MITKTAKKGSQIEMVSLDMLVPEDHLLRKIDEHIDFSFIYDLVEEKYKAGTRQRRREHRRAETFHHSCPT